MSRSLRAVSLALLLVGCGPTTRAPVAPLPPAPVAVEPAPPPAEPAAPAAAPGSDANLEPAERALVDELARLMSDVRAQFERVVTVLERASGDCSRAAATLLAPEFDSTKLTDRMSAFRGKIAAHGELSAEAKRALRDVTLAAFPIETRQRAEAVSATFETRCADDVDFQRALRAAGYPSARQP